ncbi:MAG TPA: PLDc N-terminal domain-containing protein [Acidimicrobiales bacterium]
MFATNYPMTTIVIASLVLVATVLWIVLFAQVLADVLRSHDLGGGAKTAWVTFLIVLPLLGGLIYLLARGGSTHDRHALTLRVERGDFEDYIRQVANSKE